MRESERVSERDKESKRASEWVRQREWASEWASETEKASEWASERNRERASERVSEWVNERVSERDRERESKAWLAMDEGTRGGAAIVQAVIAPRPAVPTIQCPPLLHCRVLAKRSPRISRLNCTFLKTMPALIEPWIVGSWLGWLHIADSSTASSFMKEV